jgi:hypothetical protein
MNTELTELKKERAELQGQIAALEGQRNALYMPGITIVLNKVRFQVKSTSN